MSDLSGDTKYYKQLAKRAQEQHNLLTAQGYREHDEHGVKEQWPTHTDLAAFVTDASASFNHAIAALDLGCGTGRYFHCLKNLKSLTGIDASSEMLLQAEHPVEEATISVKPSLICADLTEVQFPDASFDLVYSIGVLGEFMPFDRYFCEKIARIVKPGGKFAFTVMDKKSPTKTSWQRRLVTLCLPIFPRPLERRVRTRMRLLGLSEMELHSILTPAFARATINQRRSCTSGSLHWTCIAEKKA